MPDREKVIKALQNCSVQNDVGCQGCPYFEERKTYGHDWCTTYMAQDAIALMKEQEHKDKMYHALEEDRKRLKELLKEHEAVEPLFNKIMKHFVCPNCSLVLDEGRDDYCPSCGKRIAWDEYYIHEDETEGR